MTLSKTKIPRKILLAALTLLMCLSVCSPLSLAVEPGPDDKIDNAFELPLAGTTGYGVIDLTIREKDSNQSKNLGTCKAGVPFAILSEGQKYFNVRFEDNSYGWVFKNYTMVNLPDLIPSIIYMASNAEASLFKSCGKNLNNITGEKLYTGKTMNDKLGIEQFNMPCLWPMAKKLSLIQADLLTESKSIVLYEAFRPLQVQKLVNLELGNLMKSDKTVRTSINSWGKNWFIAKSVSNHQKGYAVDMSVADIKSVTYLDNYPDIQIPDEYEIQTMPTAMHELSPAAASLRYGVNSMTPGAWEKVPVAKTMNENAIHMRDIATNHGLSPLASEWWHFNDLDARALSNGKGNGNFEITKNLSYIPKG